VTQRLYLIAWRVTQCCYVFTNPMVYEMCCKYIPSIINANTNITRPV